MRRVVLVGRERTIMITSLLIGIGIGMLLAPLLLGVALRMFARTPDPISTQSLSGPHDVVVTISREAIGRMLDDALHELSLPLVSFRDPQIQLEPDAMVVLRMRGDTALLGAQPVVLRMRVVPTATGVGVRTESAEVGGAINVVGELTEQLDERINAELSERLRLPDQFEVVHIGGSTDAVTIETRLRN